ncbi:MAG: protein-L-isoaspartate(D-aspartate) O-methyltransferase [Bacteroidetes bacterium]|jgi:protein-L-isoaspartate(D-aspartate) O-methyltransferase|nr:protein-L-isoaspartate(D-aspartate) O-methyltransferase [Bacteroidota bacterium]
MLQTDTYRHKGMRRQLVEELRSKNLFSEEVLEAIQRIPRHFFLDKAFEEWAYQDKPFPIGHEQTISQPFTVALMTQHLQVKKREKILEIGTGSGYQAAILATLGARIYTIERVRALYLSSKALLKEMKFPNIQFFYKDGYLGLPSFAPYDKIIVTAGAPEIPSLLLQQLSIGGIMLVPTGVEIQKLLRIERTGEKSWETKDLGNVKFVPFLAGTRPH